MKFKQCNEIDFLQETTKFINNEIKQGFSGVSLLVAKNNEIIHHKSYGYSLRYDKNGCELKEQDKIKMELNTLFDIASNTKPYGTTFCIMKLYEDGKIDLNKTIDNYIKGFTLSKKSKINKIPTVKMLLNHNSGFASEVQFYEHSNKYNFFSQNREETINFLIKNLEIENPQNSTHLYSDINFMLLGIIIEQISGLRQDKFFNKYIKEPLNLENTLFIPLENNVPQNKIAATQIDGNLCNNTRNFENIRDYTLQGEVHDEKAFYCLKGIAGHAGLFSTSYDVYKLANNLLDIKNSIFKEETIKLFTKAHSNIDDKSYGLGFRIGNSIQVKKFFGNLSDKYSFGHTGFTGTFTLIDKKNNILVVLLTNSVHHKVYGRFDYFGKKNYKITQYGNVIDLVYKDLAKLLN